MIELEVKELIARHKSDMSEKGGQISQLEELNQQLTDSLDQKMADKDELDAKIKSVQEGKLSVVCFDIRAVNNNLLSVIKPKQSNFSGQSQQM